MNAVILYRCENWLYRHNCKILPFIFLVMIYLFHNSFIPYTCVIGRGTKFGYKGIGVVIHKNAVIGNNCLIAQQVTIGGRSKIKQVPIIGDNCYIGTGAKVLGDVVIGSNCVVGANAVVIEDVPDNSVVAGVPARIIKRNIDIKDYI